MKDREFLKAIGAKIKAARNEAGLSQTELGAKVNIHYSHISQIENGNVGCLIINLKHIAEALGLDVKELL